MLPIFIGVFCIYYSFKDISFSEFKEYFTKINYLWVFVGIFLGALSHISRSYRWKFLIEPLGYKLGFINSVLTVFSAYLINYTVPRAGDIARGTMISKYENIPFEKAIGTIVAERAVDVLCILIIILIGLIKEFDKISNKLIDFVEESDFSTVILSVLIAVIVTATVYFVIKRFKFYKKIKSFLSGLIDGITIIFKMKKQKSIYISFYFYMVNVCLNVLFYFKSIC